MKYFQMERTISDPNTLDEYLLKQGERSYKTLPDVNAKYFNSDHLKSIFREKIVNRRNIVKDLPCLDFFICYSISYKQEYDWILLDIYYLTGTDVAIDIRGFLSSPKLRTTLKAGHFVLGTDHHFYPAKLRFQGDYLDYFLFQYIYNNYDEVCWNKTRCWKKLDEKDSFEEIVVTSSSDISQPFLKYWYKKGINDFKVEFWFDSFTDILVDPILGYTMISERLKRDLEKNEISGIEFSEVDFLEINFKNSLHK